MKSYQYYHLSQKSRYALRALLELTLLGSQNPVGVKKLADAQDIPSRFLEVILSQLRQGGFVFSVRGKYGGYFLARPADQISAGEIIRFTESVQNEDKKAIKTVSGSRPKAGDFSENKLFRAIDEAISNVLDTTTLQDMAEQEKKCRDAYVGNYVI